MFGTVCNQYHVVHGVGKDGWKFIKRVGASTIKAERVMGENRW